MVWKLLAIAIYVGALLGIGIAASRRTRTMLDYFAGGKRIGFLGAAFSARSTGESAWLLLGLTGFGAATGLMGFWIVLGEVLGVAAGWLLLSRRFKRLTERYDSMTVPDYLESRFRDSGHGLRLLAAGSLLVFVPIYVSAQIHATGEAFSSFLGWNYYIGALFGFAIVLLYVTRGGFVAVVWSDVFQAVLMLAGLVALPAAALLSAGGIGPILETLRDNFSSHLSLTGGARWDLMTLAKVVGLMGIGLGFLGSPQVFVRLISLKGEREIGKATCVAIAWTILTDSGAVLVGVFGRALLSGGLGTEAQEVLPRLVESLLPSFLAGLYIAIVLAAIMSTIDSLLVVASSAAVRDCYQKILHPGLSNESLMSLSKGVTLLMSFIALTIAMLIAYYTGRQGIFWYAIFGWSGIAATFCPTMILSLYWSRMTALGAKCAMAAGFLSILFFQFVAPGLQGAGVYFDVLEEMAPSFLVSGLVGVLVSLLDSRGQERLIEVGPEIRSAAERTS